MIDLPFGPLSPLIVLALAVLFVFLFYRWIARLFGVVIVPEDSVGRRQQEVRRVRPASNAARQARSSRSTAKRGFRPIRSRRVSTSASGRGSTS